MTTTTDPRAPGPWAYWHPTNGCRARISSPARSRFAVEVQDTRTGTITRTFVGRSRRDSDEWLWRRGYKTQDAAR